MSEDGMALKTAWVTKYKVSRGGGLRTSGITSVASSLLFTNSVSLANVTSADDCPDVMQRYAKPSSLEW